jgi:hypothetical protein
VTATAYATGQPRAAAASSIVALPQTVDLSLYVGDDFTLTLTVKNPDSSPADLTGCTATAQVRLTAADATVAGAFTCSITTNVITCTLPHSVTSTLPAAGVWDCQLTSAGGLLTTLCAGKVTMTGDVTRP